MAYLGTPPQSGFITTAKQRVTSSTNNYVDLDHAISSIADVIVFVNFVKQDTTNLTLTTSTRITLGATLVSSDIVEIHYLGKAVNTQTPGTATVTNDMLAGSIANSKLANSSITLNGSAVSLGGSATVGGTNTPYFEAVIQNSSQDVSDNTYTKINMATENLDSAGNYDNSTNYRFTPQTAGKYYCYLHINGLASNAGNGNLREVGGAIYKNGSRYAETFHDHKDNDGRQGGVSCMAIITFNGSSDYIEAYGYVNTVDGVQGRIDHSGTPSARTRFGAFKIIE